MFLNLKKRHIDRCIIDLSVIFQVTVALYFCCIEEREEKRKERGKEREERDLFQFYSIVFFVHYFYYY